MIQQKDKTLSVSQIVGPKKYLTKQEQNVSTVSKESKEKLTFNTFLK